MYARELEALGAGVTVVTANNRLARTLRSAYEQARVASGATAWATPDVLSWSAWQQRLWEVLRLSGKAGEHRLLSDTASDYLWQRSIAELEAERPDVPVAAFARGARSAWRLLNDWGGRDAADWVRPDLSVDQQAFLRWSGRYRDRCRAGNWIDTERLPELLAAQFGAGARPPESALLFAGFELWPPARTALRDALAAAGCRVEIAAQPGPPATVPGGRACGSLEDELREAAQWARTRLSAEPQARIGVIVPELANCAPVALRAFLDVFAPAWRTGESPHDLPVNVSYGSPLSELPVVATALRLLAVGQGPMNFDELSLLLRSPWLAGGTSEAPARARCELALRERLQVEFAAAQVLRPCREQAPVFADLLEQVMAVAAPHRGPARAWAEVFAACLAAAGWPGERALDSRGYQAVEAWHAQLGNFASSGGMLGTLDAPAALTALRQLLETQVFQPEGVGVGVQVLGVLEAAGHEFDAIWVTGLASELWPAAARPDPYLPVELQRRLRMPDSTAAQALELARQRTARLLAAAPEVRVSWPAELDGEATLGPSPLLGAVQTLPVEMPAQTWNRAQWRTAEPAVLDPDPSPVMPDGQLVRGGARLLTRQATSPIDAFLEHRLGCRLIEPPAFGLSPRHKGSLTHAALEALYRAAGSQEALAELSAERRMALLESGLKEAAKRLRLTDTPLLQRLTALESAYQRPLLQRWVEFDLQRPAFTQVAVEVRHEVEMGPLRLRLQLDRLDTLNDDEQLVIDYKTGRVSRRDWNPARPGDLQLPLYVSAVAPGAAGVAFAQVATHGVGMDGVGRPGLDIPGLRTPGTKQRVEVRYQRADTGADIASWEELREAWHARLEELAFEFAAGDFRLDPLNPQSGRGQFAVLTRVFDAGPGVADAEAGA